MKHTERSWPRSYFSSSELAARLTLDDSPPPKAPLSGPGCSWGQETSTGCNVAKWFSECVDHIQAQQKSLLAYKCSPLLWPQLGCSYLLYNLAFVCILLYHSSYYVALPLLLKVIWWVGRYSNKQLVFAYLSIFRTRLLSASLQIYSSTLVMIYFVTSLKWQSQERSPLSLNPYIPSVFELQLPLEFEIHLSISITFHLKCCNSCQKSCLPFVFS